MDDLLEPVKQADGSVSDPAADATAYLLTSTGGSGGSVSAADVDPTLLAAIDRMLEATKSFNTVSMVDSVIGLDEAGKELYRKMAAMTDSMGAVDKACRDIAAATKLAARLPVDRLDPLLRNDLRLRAASCRG